MSVVEAMLQLGGVSARRPLVALTSRAEVDAAVAHGAVVVLARDRYALPAADEARQAAHRVTGVVSHLCAALHWGWAVKCVPERPDVTLPRNRKLSQEQRAGITVHRAALGPDDVVDGVTSRDRTLVDCLRALAPDEALCVADSALREGYSHARLVALARDLRGPGARQARQVAARATGKAANPFETVVRSICDEVDGLSVRPQVPLFGSDFLGQPDLVDVDLRIVIEADSFRWHGDRAALRRDARRYNAFAVHGWLVLRFAWEDVMHDPAYVRGVLQAAVHERTYRAPSSGRPA